MRIGAIGADSSHLREFTKRLNALHAEGTSTARVEAFYDPGDHDWPNPADVAQWKADTRALGVREVGSMDELLASSDGVMVLAVSGHKHHVLAAPALERGLPTYIDKPLTCDLEQARALLRLAGARNTPCYSASSLRFASELDGIPRGELGELVAIDAVGPGELNPAMEGLLHYGVHTIEMVDAIWGPGARRVSAVALPDRHLCDIEYRDGRLARLRLERKGSYEFGATIHGTKGMHTFKVDFGPVYSRLAEAMARFFSTGHAPVQLEHIVENVAVMLAGNESIRREGAWVEIG